jgi:tetratricopeptide (TPR) repeat protein
LAEAVPIGAVPAAPLPAAHVPAPAAAPSAAPPPAPSAAPPAIPPPRPLPALGPSAERLNNQAKAHFQAGRFAECAEASRRALELEPWNAVAWGNLANARFKLGQVEESRRAFDQALGGEGIQVDHWVSKAAVEQMSGRKSEALRSCLEFLALVGPKQQGFVSAIQKQAGALQRAGVQPAPRSALGFAHEGAFQGAAGRMREAVASFDRALALDPRLAVTHLVSGYVKALAEWDFEAAEASMRRALALDPRSVSGHQWYAVFLSLLGRHQEAAAHARETLALHPVSIVGHALRGLRLALDGDDAGALVEHQKAVELAPDHFLGQWGRSVSLIRLGRHEEGLSALRVAAEHSEGSVPARLHFAWGLARSARAEEARAVLADVVASKRGYVSPFLLALVRLALGQPAEALLLLDTAARDRDPWLALLLVETRFDEIRGLPELERLRERVFGGTGSGRGTTWGRPRKSFGTPSGLRAGRSRSVPPSGAERREALRQRDLSKRHAPGA